MTMLSTFWDMGGYALYVWPSYGVVLLGLIFLAYASWRKKRALEAALEKAQKKK